MVVCRGGQVETKKMQRRQLSKLDECRDCVCLALRTAARRITQGYDRALSGTGLRVTQFSLLVMIYHLRAPAMKILAAMLDNDPTTITRNVQGLVRRRLVALFPGRDSRERKVTLTSRGETVLLRALPNWQKAQADAVTSLNRSELASLRALLEQVGRRNGNVGRKRPRQSR
jgi:DNA-binding MarR family transcriptional regulator